MDKILAAYATCRHATQYRHKGIRDFVGGTKYELQFISFLRRTRVHRFTVVSQSCKKSRLPRMRVMILNTGVTALHTLNSICTVCLCTAWKESVHGGI
jgi:hypothetical protein